MSDFLKTDIGRFPASWPVQPLGTLFETQLGKMLSQKAHGGNAPKQYLRNKNVQWGHIDTSDMLEMDFSPREMEKFRLRVGDLLVCEGGEPGRAAIWQGQVEECYYQKALHRLRPIDGQMSSEFLAHWLRFSLQLENLYGVAGASSTIAHLPEVQLVSLPIPVPPLHEQRKIAAVVGLVQQAIEQQDRLLALTSELKKALLHKLFTEGLRREPQKQTEIGLVPESWEVVPLEGIAKIERGKFTHRPRNEPRFYGGQTPFVQTGDVSSCAGRIREYSQTLNEEGVLISKVFPAGTILITIAANIGFSGILEFDSACPDSLIGLTPNERIDVEFLQHYLTTQQPVMDRLAPRGTQKNINIQFLRPWLVPLPSRDEQNEIREALNAVDSKVRVARRKHAALTGLFRTLLHQLMTAQIRVSGLDLSILESQAI